MDEIISPGVAKLFVLAKRHHTELWIEHQALLQVLIKAMPYLPPEVQAEFAKYEEIKKQILDKHLMQLEDVDPEFAAQFDEEIEPDEGKNKDDKS